MSKTTFSLLAALSVLVFALAAAQPVAAHWLVTSQGQLVYQPNQQVLGEEDSQKEGEAAKHAAEQQREQAKHQEERQNQKPEESQLHLKTEDGQIKLEQETETGEVNEIGTDTEVEIEPSDDQDKIKIATGSGEQEMVVSRNRVRARTHFPLSVDLSTNELVVTTPAGVKRVAILPDQAIANLLANNVLDHVATASGSQLQLTEDNGAPVYEVEGESDKKLLGLLPVKIKAKVKVSAETGEVVAAQRSLIGRLLNLVSI